ncbi:MAG: hypothetical protein GXP35_06140 [Actinobacteria bacterium]|nr:hypothetical protein [Actinomycetota bacterium]
MATPRSTQIRRILGGGVLVAALFAAPPAGADTTYSNGSDGNTGTDVDNPTNGGSGTTPAPQPPPTDSGTDTDDAGGTGGTGNDDLGNVDNGELAFTGGDAISLALIGGTVVGAGSLLVLATRRKDEDD